MEPDAGGLRAVRVASTGSTELVEVVPAVATTAQASSRSSASARILNASSTGARRASSSSSRHAFATDECACSEATTTRAPGFACRAAASATIVHVEAVSSMWPCRPSGSPSSCASQSSVTSSSSCSAGEVRQRIPTWFNPALSSSARRRLRPGIREIREEARALPVRDRGHEDLVEIAKDVREGLSALRRARGQPRAQLPRLELGEHREVAQPLEVRRDPVDRGDAVVAEAHFRSFSIAFQGRVFRIWSFVSQARRACPTPRST